MSHLRSLRAGTWIALALAAALIAPAGAAAQDPTPSIGAPALPVAALRVQTPAYRLDAGGLSVPGYGANNIPGAPVLPVWSTVVELPPTGEPVITVDEGAAQVLHHGTALPAALVPLPPEPDPLGRPAGEDRPAVAPTEDRPDPLIYATDAFYPAAFVEAGAVQWQGGRRLLPLRVFPFQYNPVAGALRYYPDISVTVSVSQSEVDAPSEHPSTASAGSTQDAQAASGSANASILSGGVQSKDASNTNPAALPQAAGGSLRIRTGERGMYRLTGQELTTKGVPLGASLATFAVSYLGSPVAVRIVDKDGDGFLDLADLVIFYAEPYTGRYDTRNVYWFTYGGAGGPRMGTRTVEPVEEPVATEIFQTLHIENNLDYRSLYPRVRDADHWFDTNLYANASATTVTRSYTLALDDALTDGGHSITLRALVHGGTPQYANPDQSMQILLNSHDAGLYQLGGSGLYQWEGSTDYSVEATLPAAWLDASPNKVSLVAALSQLPGLTYYWISPDWVELTYAASADADGAGALYIEGTVADAGEVHVAGFTSADVRVYDIGDPLNPVELLGKKFNAATSLFSFGGGNIADPTYYLCAEDALLAPAAIELDTPSTWATADHTADYIAIVHDSLWGAIDPLLAHRADPLGDNFRVAKVDVQDIYDEFSYGRRDPEAIRSFLAHAFFWWNGGGGPPGPPPAPPQYVLLVGSGTYDFTGAFAGATKPNLIPPYLVDVDPWIGETPADNRFVSVDPPVNGVEDLLPEMAIGRIPAQSPAQVAAVVDKILAYEKSAAAGDWQRRAVYVADDCANYAENFNALSDVVRLGWLPAPYEDRTVYFGANTTLCPESDYYSVSDMITAIKAEFNSKALMLQWFGHGSRFRWGDAGSMFSNKDVPDLAANTAWPVTFSYTCWTGYFVNMHKLSSYNYDDRTLGEALILEAQRGSVADLSPSGQHLGGALLTLNQGVTRAIFTDAIDRMGPAVDAGKLYYWSQLPPYLDVMDTSILFGDPATRLRLPPLVSAAPGGGSTVKISWKHVSQYTTYRVYRNTRPYFSPEDADTELAGTMTGPFSGDVIFYDNPVGGAIGNPDANYFYLVRGVNAFGAAAVSNQAGEFDYELVPGG